MTIYNDFSEKKISALFWQYALPAIVGTCVNTLYNIIDGIFIGHWIGTDALAATGLILPIMNFAAGIGMLIGVGSASRISLYLGAKKFIEAEKIAGTSMLLSIILSGTILITMLIFIEPILYFVGASDVTMVYAKEFLQIFLPGSLFLTLAFNYNNMMRASGYPFKAMVTMFISVIANIILAPIFIKGLDMGMRGAALATVFAMMICFIFVMHHFTNKNSDIKLRLKYIRLDWPSTKAILSIGLSPFCMQMAASVIIIVINWQLNRYAPLSGITGDHAIGAFSNVNRLIMLVIMIVIGINQGMQPIVGYNFGAHHLKRVKDTFIYAAVVATLVTTTGFLVSFFIPELLVSAFTNDQELIVLSASALRDATLAFALIGFQMVTTSLFQCIGMPKISILLSLSRQILILVPTLLIMPIFFGLDGVWYSIPVSDTISSVVALVTLYWFYNSFKKRNRVRGV